MKLKIKLFVSLPVSNYQTILRLEKMSEPAYSDATKLKDSNVFIQKKELLKFCNSMLYLKSAHGALSNKSWSDGPASYHP